MLFRSHPNDCTEEEYKEFCARQDIPDIYQSTEDFAERYCFDEDDPNSILSNLTRAYDNAIVMREEIGSMTLSYIQMAVYAMNKAKQSRAPIFELQRVKDNIVAFWGIVDDSIDDEHVRSMIKLGKRVERLDLYARMHMDREELVRESGKLNRRIDRTGLTYSKKRLAHINYLVVEDEVDYEELVKEVEGLMS